MEGRFSEARHLKYRANKQKNDPCSKRYYVILKQLRVLVCITFIKNLTLLYKNAKLSHFSVRRSIRPSVRSLVRLLVGPSVTFVHFCKRQHITI